MPIIGYMTPLLTLHFLYSLAGIIDDKLNILQNDEMVNLIKTTRTQLKQVQLAHDQNQVVLTRDQKNQLDTCLSVNYQDLIKLSPQGVL